MTRYKDRPGPLHAAGDYPGQVTRGCLDDGWLWESRPNRNGVHAWKRFEQIVSSGQRDTGLRHPATNLKIIKHYVITASGQEYVYDQHGMLQREAPHNIPIPMHILGS